MSAQVTSPSIDNISVHATSLLNGPRFEDLATIRARSLERAQVICENRQKLLLAIDNTNTIPTELKRATLLQESIVDFAARIIPLRAFSSVFNAELIGDDKVRIPFYGAEDQDSVDFNDDEGYKTGHTSKSFRDIEINKRKYQGLSFSSKELRRQPFLSLVQQMRLKADKLGIDVFKDVLSLITHGNFPTDAAIIAVADFDSDDVAQLKLAAKAWPEAGRSLFIDSEYDSRLLRDSTIKNAMASGSTDALRLGRVGRELFGFGYTESSNIPSNSENLVGWINASDAILFGQSPIGPSDEVRAAMSRYEIIVDPSTGASMEYRAWGDPDMDRGKDIIECNYG